MVFDFGLQRRLSLWLGVFLLACVSTGNAAAADSQLPAPAAGYAPDSAASSEFYSQRGKERDLYLEYSPEFEYKEDSTRRQHRRLTNRLYLHQGRQAVFVVQDNEDFRKKGLSEISNTALGLGWRYTDPLKHSYLAVLKWNEFSNPVGTFFSGFLKQRSRWNAQLRSEVEIGRRPGEYVDLLVENIHERYAEAVVYWDPRHWLNFQIRGLAKSLSDGNRQFTTESMAAVNPGLISGARALYLFSTDNMEKRRIAYYSPDNVKLHQVGADYYAENQGGSYVWMRYLYGYGQEFNVDSWNVHTVDLDAGLRLSESVLLLFAAAWGKTPTYRSGVIRTGVKIEF